MTKIAISPNVSGSGVFTLTAPNSNTDRTFSLPDATGEVLTDQSNIEAQVKTAINAGGSAPIYACRAWVNFDGVTGPTIRASGNVSSVTINSTGDYTLNFATAMPDVNYCVNPTLGDVEANFGDIRLTASKRGSYTTTSVGVVVQFRSSGSSSTTPGERNVINVSVFR